MKQGVFGHTCPRTHRCEFEIGNEFIALSCLFFPQSCVPIDRYLLCVEEAQAHMQNVVYHIIRGVKPLKRYSNSDSKLLSLRK